MNTCPLPPLLLQRGQHFIEVATWCGWIVTSASYKLFHHMQESHEPGSLIKLRLRCREARQLPKMVLDVMLSDRAR